MSELGTITFGLFIIVAAVGGAAVLTWFERRLLGIWQDRYGPNRLGPFGAFDQPFDKRFDGIKVVIQAGLFQGV